MADADPTKDRKSAAAAPGLCRIACPKTPRRRISTRNRSPRPCCGTRAGSLATIDRNTGHPFASLVNVATDSDGAPLILISRLSTHTANLEA